MESLLPFTSHSNKKTSLTWGGGSLVAAAWYQAYFMMIYVMVVSISYESPETTNIFPKNEEIYHYQAQA